MADLASSRVFGNLKVTGVINGDGSGLTGTSSLRATGTTKGDVGLGSVDNYSRSHYDSRYLATGGKAADSDKLDGKHASAFATASHNHDTRYVRTDSDSTVNGLLSFKGQGTGLALGSYQQLQFSVSLRNADTPVPLPLPTNASDVIIYASTGSTDTFTKTVGRFYKTGATWVYKRIYGDSGSNHPHLLIADGVPAIGSTHNSHYDYHFQYMVASIGGAAPQPFKFFQSIWHAENFNPSTKANTSGTYSGLRAQATTKADVGLSNVRNVDAYAKTEFTDAATANTPMKRNSSGDVWARLFRTSYANPNSNIAAIYTTQTIGGDYMRPSTPAQVKSALSISAGDISGLSNAATTSVASIRSGTTKANVGLGSVRNVSSYSQTEANSNFAAASHSHSYLPLSGGTLSGNLSVTGAITATGDVTAFSDIRIKTNIESIPNALDKVSNLSGYTFDRTDTETDRQTGVIAQEVLEVLPEAVRGGPTDKDPDGHYSVAYGNMVGLLIEALKEEKSKRESLESRLEKLEALLGEQN